MCWRDEDEERVLAGKTETLSPDVTRGMGRAIDQQVQITHLSTPHVLLIITVASPTWTTSKQTCWHRSMPSQSVTEWKGVSLSLYLRILDLILTYSPQRIKFFVNTRTTIIYSANLTGSGK